MKDTDVRLARLLRRSALLATLARAAAVALLIGNVAMWLFPDLGYDAARLQSGLKPDTPISVTPSAFAFVLVVSTAHVGLLAAAMWDMARLFAGFSKQAILVPDTGMYLRRAGIFMLLFAALSPVARTIGALAVTLANPPGQRLFSISLDSQDMVLGLIAVLLVMVGHILTEAALIADDNRQIV
jgi:hypothetical protein